MASSRRLSAIMFTDMVGYTARTQADESGTLRLLQEQEALVRPLIEAHQGRMVKSTGDGILAEFPSALQATQCAVAIQERLHARNLESKTFDIELRIGIHLGDVEQRSQDIFGDAVNIAARVQPTADAGGVAISQQVFDQVRNKIAQPLEKLGAQSLKGVRFPMDVYRVVLPWNVGGGTGTAGEPEANRLAVLPFTNISPDPSDAYFSDGLTEEVIAVLSQLGELRVIARTSVEPYRTAPKSILQVGAELRVNWVVEGSVRKAGNRLRITVQLIDARSQEHIWAGTFDRQLDDVFALQSEMAQRIAEALKIKIVPREETRLQRRRVPVPESYLEYLQGRAHLRGVTEETLQNAKRHFERAIELDEENAAAHTGLADVHGLLGELYYHLPREEWEQEVRRHAARAIELDPDLAEAHTTCAWGYFESYDYASAEKEFQIALSLNPSLAGARHGYAVLLATQGQPEAALREFTLAEQLDPSSSITLAEHVSLLLELRRVTEAEPILEKLGRAEGAGILYHDRKSSLAAVRGDLKGYAEEIELLNKLFSGRPEITTAHAVRAALAGEKDRARELLKSVESLPEPARPDVQIAWVYCLLDDLDSCFAWMNVAREHRRLPMRIWRYDPHAERVRKDPRFVQLLADMHLN